MKKRSLKILGISLLTLSLLAGCGNKPSSSEPSSSSSETSQSSEPISSNTQSSSSSSIQEKGYKIEIGGEQIELTKDDQVETGVKEQYSATLTSVTAGEEVVFYVDGKVKKPSVTQLGNNVVLNESYKTEIHNDAINVKLTLKVLDNGLEVWLDGYQNKIINNFRVTVNGEDKDVENVTTLPEGIVHKFSVKLNPQDKLVVFGDESKLCIGGNAMHYETEYVASLPGNYIVEVNEYNRLFITEPVLTTEELYLLFINDVQTQCQFVTPDNPEDKAQINVELSKGDELVIKYADGSTLGSVSAVANCSYTIYINKEGHCYPTMTNISLNISATADGQTVNLVSAPLSDGNLAVYRLQVEVGQIVQIFNDGEVLKYHDGSETSFVADKTSYTIYINNSMQVWEEEYIPEIYTEVVVTGVTASLIENRNMFVWTWKTSADGKWVEQSPTVNADGTVTVYLPEGYENFLIITTEKNKTASWDNVKSQTNDSKVSEGTASVTWKTQENVGGSTTPSTPVTGYVIKGNFENGNEWAADINMTKISDDIYEGTITVSGTSAELKVKKAGEELWYPDNNVVIEGAGTYKITFTVSTKTITFVEVN